jgi:hypothetical protein
MTDKHFDNMAKETSTITDLLNQAYDKLYFHGGSSQRESIVNLVQKEPCSMSPEETRKVLASIKETKVLEDGTSKPLAFIYSNKLTVPVDCKK